MALIALSTRRRPIVPPLTLAYVATLLEQRRHIVRIYDLALAPQQSLAEAFEPLVSFRPQVVVIAGDQPDLIGAAIDALPTSPSTHVLPVQMSRSGLDAGHVCAGVLSWVDRQVGVTSPLNTDFIPVDQLPLPARHLLSLESYNLRAIGNELQTTLVVGALAGEPGQITLRNPTQIVAELRSVSHEFGLRHYLIEDVPLTIDHDWLVELLTRVCDADLGVGWEASAEADRLTPELIDLMARAGCELLHLPLSAVTVFESLSNRDELRRIVGAARERGIFVRAIVKLEPPYESIPHLVDVAATFGLDDVRFDVVKSGGNGAQTDEQQIREMAQQIYEQGRDRQRFISRFGPALGNLIWRLRGPRGSSPDFDEGGLSA